MRFESLNSLLEDTIAEYHKLSNAQVSSYSQAWDRYMTDVKAGQMTPEYSLKRLEDARNLADRAFEAQAQQLNKRYYDALKAQYSQVLKATIPERTQDHATKMSVALQLLRIEGKSLTDSVAADILKEFISKRDFDALEQFHRVIERQTAGEQPPMYDTYGKTTWPETFKDLYNYRSLTDAYKEATKTAEMIFMFKRKKTDTENTSNAEKYLPCDGYYQPLAEANAPVQITKLDSMLAEFFPD